MENSSDARLDFSDVATDILNRHTVEVTEIMTFMHNDPMMRYRFCLNCEILAKLMCKIVCLMEPMSL